MIDFSKYKCIIEKQQCNGKGRGCRKCWGERRQEKRGREEARQGCNRGYVRKRGAWEEETGRGWARNYCHMTRMWRRQRAAEGPSPNGTEKNVFYVEGENCSQSDQTGNYSSFYMKKWERGSTLPSSVLVHHDRRATQRTKTTQSCS